MPLLGVNIDHVATLRQQRREEDPDPVKAALICQEAGADSIVAHLREDRRHISDKDVRSIKKALRIRFNMEISLNPGILDIALELKPHQVTLVPERRKELTTEGGLDIIKNRTLLKKACERFYAAGIPVSLFIDPVIEQIDAAKVLGVPMIELHTGKYAAQKSAFSRNAQLKILTRVSAHARKIGLIVNAGHGLKYHNTGPIAAIAGMNELNIGHAIISRAVFVGLAQAVREMVALTGQGTT